MIGDSPSAEQILSVRFNGAAFGSILVDGSGNAQFGGGLQPPATTIATTPITVTAANSSIYVDATGGAATVNLPTAVGNTGKIFTIAKIDSGTNTVTIDPNGSETINGATTAILSVQFDNITIQSDGANWRIIG